MTTTCRTCYFCVPYCGSGGYRFHYGTCYQAKRRVSADMTACSIYKERGEKMAVKSKASKRNTYRDKDGNSIVGVTIQEVLNKPVTILAKREYTWGLYSGLAVMVQGANGKLAIVEITAETPIKALCDHNLPKPPFLARFVEKTSKNKRKYYTVEVLNGNEA